MTTTEFYTINDGSIRQWIVLRLRGMRLFSLPVSVLPVLVATAASLPIYQWRWNILIISVVGVGLLHIAANLLNDYFDFRSGVDRKLEGDENRPGRLLVRGELKPWDVFGVAVACLILAGIAGLYLLWVCGMGVLWFGLAGVVVAYAYTGPPLRLKYRMMGELAIFITFGPILMSGAAYAQTAQINYLVLILAIPIGLATTAILVGNNFRDLEEDREAGIKTLAHFAEGKLARLLYVFLVVSCVLILAVMGAGRIIPPVMIATPAILILLRKPLVHIWRNERLADIDAGTARFVTAVLLMLLVALIVK